jgi:hypothetical protein
VIRVADFPERIPLVPLTLADFECEHGMIGGCAACADVWWCVCGYSNPEGRSVCRNCGLWRTQ